MKMRKILFSNSCPQIILISLYKEATIYDKNGFERMKLDEDEDFLSFKHEQWEQQKQQQKRIKIN